VRTLPSFSKVAVWNLSPKFPVPVACHSKGAARPSWASDTALKESSERISFGLRMGKK
jgi:hypothetical protein